MISGYTSPMRIKNPLRTIPHLFLLALTTFGMSCSSEPATLRIGMMPAVDIAPFYYAQENGIFAEHDVQVELILFTNGQNRQTALQTNQVDGAMTDLVALVTNTAGDFPLRGVLATEGVFPLLVHESTGLQHRNGNSQHDPAAIGVMEISITNYIAEKYLDTHFPEIAYETVYINEIPTRLEAVHGGQLSGGIFPEPVASIGEHRGLTKLVYDDIPDQSPDIIAFTETALQQKDTAISALVSAYNQAAEELRADHDLSRDVLMRNIPNLPPEVRRLIILPEYRPAHLPDNGFIQEIIDWTGTAIGRELSVHPEDIIDRRYLAQ